VYETTGSSFSLITELFDCKPINPLGNKFVKALEHFSVVPFSKLILNETILIIFSISQLLESFAARLVNLAAHPLRITDVDEYTFSASSLARTNFPSEITAHFFSVSVFVKVSIFQNVSTY
jgi:hypothetical protein